MRPLKEPQTEVPTPPPFVEDEPSHIEVVGARMHNLKDIHVRIPRHQLTVITGLSGSGKSSLAFDTLYAEGQRRYVETFSAYARRFIGEMERPDVDQITGLSPVIAIEQKTTARNPRSTVGTVTEIYDFLRLLFARIGQAYSWKTGQRMVQYTEAQMQAAIAKQFAERRIVLLAPLVRGRKGHYRELFEQVRRQGFTKVRVDGQIRDLQPGMQLDRYKVHDIELVVDRLRANKTDRLAQSLRTALKIGEGIVVVMDYDSGQLYRFSKHLMDPDTGLSYEAPSPNTFSFNSPYGACPTCSGLGNINEVNVHALIPDDSLSINKGGLAPLGELRENDAFKQLRAIAKRYGFSLATPIKDIPKEALELILFGDQDAPSTDSFADEGLSYTPQLAQVGLTGMLKYWYTHSSSEKIRQWAEAFMHTQTCSDCHGYRLRKESLHFLIAGKHIGQLACMDLRTLAQWLQEIVPTLDARQRTIGRDIFKELHLRIGFLLDVGLDYLSLDRPARTLSGGESQRIRLATQIGSKLSGITYILDEPSIGLHPRDNHRLIQALRELTHIGNTVIVVEHDKDIMLAANYIIDLGPGAGKHGGQVVAEGPPKAFVQTDTCTAQYLRGERRIPTPMQRRQGSGQWLELLGATGHNLKNVDVAIPLGTFTCITGVSGSGKSSLINETLYPILRQHLYKSLRPPLPFRQIKGLKHINKVIDIDQAPIGRTPRSNPATYTGVFNDIRKLFADLPESKIRGYKPGRFSFNVKGGRCEACKGSGMRVIEMNFLPDVYVECEHCLGRRYNRETLEVLYKGKSISDVLDMTVEEAMGFFSSIPRIYRKLKTLYEVGLGYVTLGQQATTLSGGEAQRVKLAEELSKRTTGNTLYILDEPTTGLHFEDIHHLLAVLQRLVDKGNTVIVIEHNLDVIKVADYIIDMGPEGGARGGQIVATGTPEEVAQNPNSHTGRFLRDEL